MLRPWSPGRDGRINGALQRMTDRPAYWAAVLRAVFAFAGLGGCAADRAPPPGEPSMYASMATTEAELDAPAAAAMISGHRPNNGLTAVTIDPELMKLAAMAPGKMDHNVIRDFVDRLRIAG